MRSQGMLTLLALAMEARADLKASKADLENTTLAAAFIPQMRGVQRAPFAGLTPMQGYNQMSSPMLARSPMATPVEFNQPQVVARAFGPSMGLRAEEAPAPAPAGPKNVYGESLKSCSSDLDCAYNEGAPQICVSLRARERVGTEGSFKLVKGDEKALAQWSDGWEAQCISIWDFTDETVDGTWEGFAKWCKFGSQEIVPKCSALPSNVLDSKYSVEMWRNCEITVRKYSYVDKKSPNWKPDTSEVTTKDTFKISKPSLGEETPELFSQKCARFRKVISGICNICELQEGGSVGALKSACTAIEGPVPAMMLAETQEGISTTAYIAGVIGFFVGSGIVLATFRRVLAHLREPLLEGYSS